MLTTEATVVLIGGPLAYRGLGPLPHIGGTILKSKGRSQTARFFVTKIEKDGLAFMAELLEAGKITPVIDRALRAEARRADALRYLGEGHARGKVIISV